MQAHFKGKTKPLSELAPRPGTDQLKRANAKANRPNIAPDNFRNWKRQPKVNLDALPFGDDPVRQRTYSAKSSNSKRLFNPNLVFDGMQEEDANVGVPDTNGEASPDHYIQMINASFIQVFDKQGNALTDPMSTNTIWSELNETSFGDPIVLWDEDANRWLLTDLAGMTSLLYAVSETNDPMGAWNVYVFDAPGFTDYPKYGVWPNAYICNV